MKTRFVHEVRFMRGGWHRTSSRVVSLLLGIAVSACNPAPQADPATEASPAQSAVERGEVHSGHAHRAAQRCLDRRALHPSDANWETHGDIATHFAAHALADVRTAE